MYTLQNIDLLYTHSPLMELHAGLHNPSAEYTSLSDFSTNQPS